jgi:hypothetical protein
MQTTLGRTLVKQMTDQAMRIRTGLGTFWIVRY